jgi:hypothetical protein
MFAFFGMILTIPLIMSIIFGIIKLSEIILYGRQPAPDLEKEIQSFLRKVDVNTQIMNSSASIKKVMSSYDENIHFITQLTYYERDYPKRFPNNKPNNMLIRLKADKANIFTEAIKRAHRDMLSKLYEVKTDLAKQKRKVRFFESLMEMKNILPLETYNYVRQLISESDIQFAGTTNKKKV